MTLVLCAVGCGKKETTDNTDAGVTSEDTASPEDADGGGNNDIETAKKIGTWATKAGMRVLIDFHYSDFWADPSKQRAPKEWEDLSVDEKAVALRMYTEDSLNALIDAGVDVGMVQIGNETTTGFCGEKEWEDMCTLFKAGSEAVRGIDKDILIAIHFTNPEKAGLQSGYAANLASYGDEGVSYDVFASSYYPFWHGSLGNLKSVLSVIATTYGK